MSLWIRYTLARLAFFVVAFIVLLVVGTGWLLGAIFASLIALALSVLFLSDMRTRIAADIQKRVQKPSKDIDSDIEDDQIDSASN